MTFTLIKVYSCKGTNKTTSAVLLISQIWKNILFWRNKKKLSYNNCNQFDILCIILVFNQLKVKIKSTILDGGFVHNFRVVRKLLHSRTSEEVCRVDLHLVRDHFIRIVIDQIVTCELKNVIVSHHLLPIKRTFKSQQPMFPWVQ